MKIINGSTCLFVIIFLMACSKDNKNEVPIPVDNEVIVEEEEVEEPKEVLDFVNVETIADTPIPDFDSFLVFEDKLFAVKAKDTYVFDFASATWSFLGTDTDMPRFLDLGVSFLRNGKWNLFTNRGLFEFDFDLEDWQVIDSFTPNGEIFYTNGFYMEAEEAIYFTDRANGNDNIYKYDLLINELTSHSTYENKGDWGGIAHNTFVINGSHYVLGLGSYRMPHIYKFNDDFSELPSINDYSFENQLDGSVAMHFGDYLIFGLGGTPSVDADGTITHDPSNLNFYYYDFVKDIFGEMPSPFYEPCRVANLITYNNEFYLINGFTNKNQKSETRNTIEKIEFDIVKK